MAQSGEIDYLSHAILTCLRGEKMIYQTLNGTWYINEKGSEAYIEGKVPGSVLSSLLLQHRLQDPYFGTNEYSTCEIFRGDFYFTREFDVVMDLMSQERIYLVCKGIDTLAKIYINDMPVGKCDNMHRTYYFEIKDLLYPTGNRITIELDSPIEYIEDRRPGMNKTVKYTPVGCMQGNQYLRKSQCMFGSDWSAKLPDCGIWRSIDLVGHSFLKLDEAEIIQHHEDGVSLEVNVKAEIFHEEGYVIQAELISPEGRIKAATVGLVEGKCTINIPVEGPKLWWPNGLGDQPLYTLSLYALDMNGNQWDQKSYRIGLRTLTVSTEKDEYGREFCFVVNGVKMFSMGANYVPEDEIYPFITREKIDYLLKACVRSNFNTIRVWGGGYYPSETFYDLCDEYGLIVWQDMMFSRNLYELNDDFRRTVEAEAIDNIKRMRNHACLGLICGNNEIEESWCNDKEVKKHSEPLKQDYIMLFEGILPKIVKEYAKGVFYWPSSPSSGGGFNIPSDENRGDCHYRELWQGDKSFSEYKKHLMRFCTEFGFQSFPSLKTIKTFTKAEDRNIFSDVMESHQKDEGANGKMLYYMSQNFLFPKDLESLLYLTQITQGLAIKGVVEHFRRNRGRCMGALYWQLNDCWPVASWSSIDYYGRYKALHYMARKFYAPVAGSIEKTDNVVAVYVQNETRNSVVRRVKISLQTFEFRLLHDVEYEVELKPFEAVKVCEINYGPFIEGLESRVFMEAVFIDDENNESTSEIEIFVPYKRLALEASSISYSVIELMDEFVIRMLSSGFSAFVELDLKQADAVFSENYFHLTSKHEKAIHLKKSDIRYLNYGSKRIQNGYELEQQLVIRTLKDSF